MLLQASEKSRRIVESYFTPGKKLHFSFTHLVCRTAVDGKEPFILLVPDSQRVSSVPAMCSQETVLPLFSLFCLLYSFFKLKMPIFLVAYLQGNRKAAWILVILSTLIIVSWILRGKSAGKNLLPMYTGTTGKSTCMRSREDLPSPIRG